MAKVRGKEDLPEWFNLKEYQGCKSFIAIDWATALKKRLSVLELIDHGDLDDAKQDAERIWQDPTDCLCFEWSYPESPIRPLTFSDLAFQGGTALVIGSVAPKAAGNWVQTLNAIASGGWLSSTLNREPIDSPGSPSSSILVNLAATDSVLIDAFAAWLKDMRLQRSDVSKRELPAYRSWARYGLLPYLDLFIWVKLTGNQISHQVMSEVVGYDKGGEAFRRTVPKLRIELAKHIAELEALATTEHYLERPAS